MAYCVSVCDSTGNCSEPLCSSVDSDYPAGDNGDNGDGFDERCSKWGHMDYKNGSVADLPGYINATICTSKGSKQAYIAGALKARAEGLYVGGHDHYELRDNVIVVTSKTFSHLEDKDFRNFDHYKLWNVDANTAYVSNKGCHTPLTVKLFGGFPTKYAYGQYDSAKTKELKKSYNSLVDQLYDSTKRFTSMASDAIEPNRVKLANIEDKIRQSNYADYKQEYSRRRALGIPQD